MSADVPRRSLFAAGMGLTLAGLGLSACSTPTATAAGGGAPNAGSGSSPAAGAGSGGSAAAGSSTVSVKVADVPVGGGVILQTASVVVTQPTAGTFRAFSSVCTHQGCPVSRIAGGAIICPCHNSHFSVADGSVLSGPAHRPLPAAKVTQSGDSLVVS